ncbi:1,5-anhydro-D-fructose reductase [Lignipirellula cremea]|uniref:1,5-anhydro-D-fructose reductase n=2 Tax=Lignipirellula cremea TaxID=2528010 RepID=A0A518DNC8_9BACT|nr:1,5-anhydro-D-fructose reductase [Lignipirellula cremea]
MLDPPLNYLPRMPRQKDVPIGCIGAGFIMADCHLPAYRRAGFRPRAIASRSRASAEKAAGSDGQMRVYDTCAELLADRELQVIDLAVPPDVQLEMVREIVRHRHIRGLLAQKPLGVDYAQAKEIVELCEQAGIVLAVNQNMRWDHSIRGCRDLLDRGLLGDPVFASIDMRAVPHWMPWQERLGWVTLRIMSIHHLDAFRFLFGDPRRVFASVRSDPRTAKKFPHEDGVCLYILEYDSGLRASSWDDVWAGPEIEGAEADIGIRWRLEGTEGLARGTIGWPKYPARTPSTLDFASTLLPGGWRQPRWEEAWFPDAFSGPMAALLCALEDGVEPEISGRDNLKTMALVDACYLSAREHRAVEIAELLV